MAKSNSTPGGGHPHPQPFFLLLASLTQPFGGCKAPCSPSGAQHQPSPELGVKDGSEMGQAARTGEERGGQGWLEGSQGSGSPRTGKGRLGGAIWAGWARVSLGSGAVRPLGRGCWLAPQVASHPVSRRSGVSSSGGGREEVGGVTGRAVGRDEGGGGGTAWSWGWGDSDITPESVLKQQPVRPGRRETVGARWRVAEPAAPRERLEPPPPGRRGERAGATAVAAASGAEAA